MHPIQAEPQAIPRDPIRVVVDLPLRQAEAVGSTSCRIVLPTRRGSQGESGERLSGAPNGSASDGSAAGFQLLADLDHPFFCEREREHEEDRDGQPGYGEQRQ